MRKINLKGVTAESVTGIAVLFLALVNTVLQTFGINILPIDDENISEIISSVFLILTTLYNVWKNRNFTLASQKGQEIVNSIKTGELLIEQVDELLSKIKK